MSRPPLRFLADANVQRSLAEWLAERGHELYESRDIVGPRGADEVISWIASKENLIVVTYDRDFRTAARRVAPTGTIKRMRHRASVLWLHVPEPQARQRLEQCIDYIEGQFATAQAAGYHIELCEVTRERVNFRVGTPHERNASEWA